MATANRYGFTIDKGLNQTWANNRLVASGGAATIGAGSPTKGVDNDAASPWLGTVVPMVDGDGIVTSQRFHGIAKSQSTDTAAAAGNVDLWVPVAGLVYRGAAKSASSANTQTLATALIGKKVIFDLTGTVWSVDVAAADALVNCVVIVGAIPQTSEILFCYSPKGTYLDTSSSQ